MPRAASRDRTLSRLPPAGSDPGCRRAARTRARSSWPDRPDRHDEHGFLNEATLDRGGEPDLERPGQVLLALRIPALAPLPALGILVAEPHGLHCGIGHHGLGQLERRPGP